MKKINKNGLFIAVFFISLYAVYYVYLSFAHEYTEYITNTYSLNSKNQTGILALFYTLGRGFILFLGVAAIYGVFYAMRKKYFFLLSAIFCFLIGFGSVFALIKLTPSAEIKNFIHILIICFFVIILGIVFIYAQYKKKK
ncbi:MAG TPA: hypothetical protein DHW82_00800 [Spirochaetia bacterium]|nr:MAG: hypothetical protein A2Y41_10205 [Spirochaetes bacterium GWB1_36_13]HCL55536.1 hypothetical protein [Spirochaetia bacterium]